MNERDFDKLFQDKIGDELPFDFQPADWQKVSRSLDEVLPNTPLLTPESVALTAVKKAWWWAAAAATVLVASNVWLIYQLRETKREVATLRVPSTEKAATQQNTQIVVVRDTVYQTVYANAPHLAQTPTIYSKALLKPKSSKKQEENIYKNENQSFIKKDITNALSNAPLRATAEKDATPNNRNQNEPKSDKSATPPPPQYVQANMPQPDFGNETNIATQPTYATVAEKYANTLKNNKNNIRSNVDNINNVLQENDLNILDINRLQRIGYQFNNLSSYEVNDYITKMPIKPLKKVSLPIISGWALGVHKTWLFDQPSYRKAPKTEGNVGATIAADLGRNWRVSASFDYWHEYQQHIDSADRQSVPEPPAHDYRFDFMEIESPLAQVRLGVDYYLPRFGSNTFFLGVGLSRQWLTKPEEKYVFKQRPLQPNPQPQQPQFKEIELEGSDKNIHNFALLRFGTEGSIYRGLGWNANVYSQWCIKDFKDQTFGIQAGLQYRF